MRKIRDKGGRGRGGWIAPALLPLWVGAALIVASLLPRLYYANTNQFSYDETHNLTFATLANQGNVPYREVFIGIAPFALISIQAAAAIWEDAPQVRLIMVAYGLLGVLALFLLVKRRTRPHALTAGALAALLFSFNPHYFAVSTTINLEAAALSFGLLSVLVADVFRQRNRAAWLLLSGVFFGLSMGIKVLVPFVAAVVLAQVVIHAYTAGILDGATLRKRAMYVVGRMAIWSAGVLLVALLFLLIYDEQAMFRGVVDFRLELRGATLADDSVNVTEELGLREALQYGPLLLALVGAWRHYRRGDREVWVWVVWLTLGALFLMTHVPLRPRHLVTVLPPLAALSGSALAGVFAWKGRGVQRRALTVAAALVLAAVHVPGIQAARIRDFTDTRPARGPAIEMVRDGAMPEDCVLSKENRLYFLADRLPPPYLSEVSTARLFSGMLSTNRLIRLLAQYDCSPVEYSESFDALAPDLRPWLDEHYALRLTIRDVEDDEAIQVYAVPMEIQRQPQHPAEIDLGGEIEFRGFDLSDAPFAQGDVAYLATYWQAQQPPTRDWKLFVHLIDAQGELAQAFDHFPFETHAEYQVSDVTINARFVEARPEAMRDDYPATGMIPTSLWLPGQTLREVMALPLDLEPGRYVIRVGMYDPMSMERLNVDDAQPDGTLDQIPLATIDVGAAE